MEPLLLPVPAPASGGLIPPLGINHTAPTLAATPGSMVISQPHTLRGRGTWWPQWLISQPEVPPSLSESGFISQFRAFPLPTSWRDGGWSLVVLYPRDWPLPGALVSYRTCGDPEIFRTLRPRLCSVGN